MSSGDNPTDAAAALARLRFARPTVNVGLLSKERASGSSGVSAVYNGFAQANVLRIDAQAVPIPRTGTVGTVTLTIETSLDDGATWTEIAMFEFTGRDTQRQVISGAWGDLIRASWEKSEAARWDIAATALASVDLAIASLGGSINFQTDPVYTLVLADASRAVSMDNSDPNVVYVPAYADVPFPDAVFIPLRQAGVGQTRVEGMPGVNVYPRELDALKIAGQHGWATLIHIAANDWEFTGDTTP